MKDEVNGTLVGAGSCLALCLGVMFSVAVHAQDSGRLDPVSEIRPFAVQVQKRFGLDSDDIVRLLASARIEAKVLKAIQRPAEALSWRKYRRIFMTPTRIDRGVQFWKRHQRILDTAASQYAVAPEIIVAIIGVETLYGSRKGKIRVLDALATLGFRYPKRGKFFRSELQHYLMLVNTENLDPLTLQGSYAGAMGIPQFIPSSYRRYAVDFDNDRIRDLINSPADAIGSVANYLARHGWRADADIAVRAQTVSGAAVAGLQARGLKPHTRLLDFKQQGINAVRPIAGNPRAALIVLQGEDGEEYWLGMNNFYVITRYNHSPLYAMAVFQLATEIKRRYGARTD